MAQKAPARVSAATRWLGVGSGCAREPARAGADAARAAITGADPKLLLVFAGADIDLDPLLASIAETAPGVPLVGATTAGEIAPSGAARSAVVVAALGGEGFSASTEAVAVEAGGLRDAAAEAAACLGDVAHREHQVLLLLTASTAGDQQEAVRGAYSVAGAGVPIVGGCSSAEPGAPEAFQLHGATTFTNAVVAAAIGSDAPLGVGVRHGWHPDGEPMLVTQSSGTTVRKLGGEPALDLYLDRLGAPAAARDDAHAFARFALGHPLGLRRGGDEDQVRLVVGADFDARALIFSAEVPHGGLAWFMRAGEADVLGATDDACRQALDALGGAPAAGLVAFDSVARRELLGSGVGDEVARIAAHAGGAPVAGMCTFGEFARTHGISGFHNQSLVVLAVA